MSEKIEFFVRSDEDLYRNAAMPLFQTAKGTRVVIRECPAGQSLEWNRRLPDVDFRAQTVNELQRQIAVVSAALECLYEERAKQRNGQALAGIDLGDDILQVLRSKKLIPEPAEPAKEQSADAAPTVPFGNVVNGQFFRTPQPDEQPADAPEKQIDPEQLEAAITQTENRLTGIHEQWQSAKDQWIDAMYEALGVYDSIQDWAKYRREGLTHSQIISAFLQVRNLADPLVAQRLVTGRLVRALK